jgi:hypothetical protein
MSDVTTTEPSVEDCLKELREMFPKTWAYVTVQQSGDCSPRGKCEVETFVIIQVDSNKGDIIYNDSSDTLSEAMAQIRAWHSEQAKE